MANSSGCGFRFLAIQQFETDFLDIIAELNKRPGAEIGASGLQDFLENLTKDTLYRLRQSLNSISASRSEISFEKICERLVTSVGYRVEGRNLFDSAGGDVDLRCVRQRSDSSPFEAGEALLFVQIKKHEGKTDEWAVNQLLKMIEKEPAADGCVMSLAGGFHGCSERTGQE